MVVLVHMDDILAHAQATVERFAPELGEKVSNDVDGKKFSGENARRTPASSGVPTLFQSNEP